VNELELMSGRLAHLLEVGRKISADRRKKLAAALSALQAVLAEEEGGQAQESQRDQVLAEARELLEADFSHNQREQLLRAAIKAKVAVGEKHAYVWMRDVYDTWCVYEHNADYGESVQLYKVSYVVDDQGTVTLGEPTAVIAQTVYTPVTPTQQESGEVELVGDLVPLVEKAIRKDGTVPIKVIAPGWGSSGYYSADTLKRDGPKAFTKGLHMHVDHPTAAEEAQRPERSVNTIGAVLSTDARWEESGPAGPGLYAEAKPLGDFAQKLPELAPHIGVSIRALGKATTGEAEGKKGPIIESIVAAKSVDFVTVAGAGGKVLELFEAARSRPREEVREVTEEEARQLREANAAQSTELARLREILVLREARDYVVEVLAQREMPELTRARLVEQLAAKPVVKDGALDREAFKTAIEEAAKSELEYLAKISGQGQIRGMGSAAPAGEGDRKGLVESWRETFLRQGETPEQAQRLAELAAR
jgi:hypothetical protein